MTDLGAWYPTDINNRDEVIGSLDFVTTAYLWRDGDLIDLGSLGGLFNFPVAINDRSQVVGSSSDQDNIDVPFIWSGARMRALPLTSVSDINNRGQVAGGRPSDPAGFHDR